MSSLKLLVKKGPGRFDLAVAMFGPGQTACFTVYENQPDAPTFPVTVVIESVKAFDDSKNTFLIKGKVTDASLPGGNDPHELLVRIRLDEVLNMPFVIGAYSLIPRKRGALGLLCIE